MHGLLEIIFLNRNNREAAATLNARDPGHSETRRAAADLGAALDNLLNSIPSPEPESSPKLSFGTDFVFQVHGTEGWLLPISHRGREIASRIFPDDFRRYGLHYILDLATERDDAILQSIHAAYA